MVTVGKTAFMCPVRTFPAGTVGRRYVDIRRVWKVSLIVITQQRFFMEDKNGKFKYLNI